MSFSKYMAAACGLATVANGHMYLATPVRATAPKATNGPLATDGRDFPCQLKSGDTLSGESTSMALGSDQPLGFLGQSVHGGGSCQVSITYDENPTADSTWKVITSIEGGCPARDTAGNLGTNTLAEAIDPYSYNFTVPDDIPSGKAVLAWTWFNKVGNREMYMQCAMVDLTGTSGSQSSYESLPDMFTANIGNGCSTADDADTKFPDPGLVVQTLGSSTLLGPLGDASCGSSGISVSASAGISIGAPSATTSAASTETAAAGGIFASVSASVGASEPTTTAAAAPAAATTAVSSDSSSSSSVTSDSSSSSSSGSETAGAACSDEGSNICTGGSSYLVCASGLWTSMPVATGTACSGSGNTFAIAVARDEGFKTTRALRWVQRNLPFLG